jgi:hypothetical protein
MCVVAEPLYCNSDSGMWHSAITGIAIVALRCKFILACGSRINPTKGSTGFATYRYTSDSGLWLYAITVIAESYRG